MVGKRPQLLERQAVEFQRLLQRDSFPLDYSVDQAFGDGCGHEGRVKTESLRLKGNFDALQDLQSLCGFFAIGR
jgi:hypothetical protein